MEALDQPFTHHRRLDPSSTLGVHNWWAILLYHNHGIIKQLANSNKIFVVNCFVFFDYARGAATIEEGRPLPQTELPPT